MSKLSDNYYLRKCFLEREQVPTQTVMINTMAPPLAAVYFKSMTYKLKVLAGFEPPMRGGGSDWYQPPKDILEGRAVLKPVKKEYLKKLSFEGIGFYGQKFVADHHKQMEDTKRTALLENDINWKRTIETNCRQEWDDSSKEAANKNTEAIQNAFREFTTMYTTSITKIEQIIFDGAVKEIQSMREEAFAKMDQQYAVLLKQQATMLYQRYTNKLNNEKARLKADFIKQLEEYRTDMSDQIHDLHVDKHIIIEKVRQLLESQNLACQVYVALREREECKKEMDLSKHEHDKKVKTLKEQIAMKDFEIRLAQEKEKKRNEFIRIWQKKVCQVVKKFQMFVSYCLSTLPDHADFFIDMEKLMMLQLNDIIENPNADSIFVIENLFDTPVPKPHPFYLFCDKGYKPELDQNLCPKHCTSSTSQMPVVVVNKRFIYGACDKFEKFTDKISQFIQGHRGNDEDFDDDHEYHRDVPVKCTSSQQLLELKLESSIQQILQKEMPNLKAVPIDCCVCKIPYCFCSPLHASEISLHLSKHSYRTDTSKPSISSGNKIETRSAELKHEREPKWESYMNYVEPKKCKCPKTAKKHLVEHLPSYMRTMSTFEASQIPNYEMCDVDTLRRLVRKAQGKHPPTPPPPIVHSRTREVGIQYSDQEFNLLCTCFSDDEVDNLFRELMEGTALNQSEDHFKIIGGDVSPSYMSRSTSSFTMDCAYTLRHLLDDSPELEEIFKHTDCKKYEPKGK